MRRRLLVPRVSGCTLTINSCHPSGALIFVNGDLASIGDTFSFNNGDRVTIQATYTDWPVYSKTFIITQNMSYDIEMANSFYGFTNVGNDRVYVKLMGFGVSDATSLTGWEYSFDQGDTWTDAQYDVSNDMVFFANDYSTEAGIQPGQTMLIRHKTPIFTSYETGGAQRYMEFDFVGNGQINVSGRLSEMCRLTELTPSSGYSQKGFGGLFYSQNCLNDCSGFILDVDFSQIACSAISGNVGYGGYQSMFKSSYITKCPTVEAPLTVPQYGFADLFANCDSRPTTEFTCYSLNISASHALRGMFLPVYSWSTDGTFYCPQSMINTWPDATAQNDFFGGIPPSWRRVGLVQHVTIKSCNIAGASITVNGNSVNVGDSVECSFGDTITISASATDYLPYSETFTIGKTDVFVNINMEEDPSTKYLTFDVVVPGSIGFFRDSPAYMDARTIYYRKNGGSWTSLSTSNFDPGQYGGYGEWITGLVAGDVLEFKGENDAYCEWSGNEDPDYANQGYTYFRVLNGTQFNVSGNIMSLCYGDNFVGKTDFPQTSYYDSNTGQFTTGPAKHVFQSLFCDNTGLLSAKYLILPVTTLSNSCYMCMFSGCTNMTDAPDYLPNATLANWCYMWMFSGCSSLQKSPDILTITVPSGNQREAYGMFGKCSSLNYVKCLFANLGYSTTASWFQQRGGQGVPATGTFVKNAANTSWTTGTSGIPSGWTVESVVV